MSDRRHAPTGRPLSIEIRGRIAALVQRVGERAACRQLGISDKTLARCLAGMSVHAGTAAIVSMRLDGMPL